VCFEHLKIVGVGGCNSFDTLLMICLGFVGMFENLKIMCNLCGFKNKRMVQDQQSESLSLLMESTPFKKKGALVNSEVPTLITHQ
jgi:hypothetical protein